MQRANSLEKTLTLGKFEGKKSRGQQRMRWLDSITSSMDMNLLKLRETVETKETSVLQPMRLQRVGHDLATECRHPPKWYADKRSQTQDNMLYDSSH